MREQTQRLITQAETRRQRRLAALEAATAPAAVHTAAQLYAQADDLTASLAERDCPEYDPAEAVR